jgi:hypothetical protein
MDPYMRNKHHVSPLTKWLKWAATGVCITTLIVLISSGQAFAQESVATPTPPISVIDISESVTIGSGVLGGMGEPVNESVTIGSGVLGGMGEPVNESVTIGSGVLGGMGELVTESVTTSSELMNTAGVPTPIPVPSKNEMTPEASGVRSNAIEADETEASASQNRGEPQERSSRETGETPDANDARSDARDGGETEASDSQNSDERRERPSRDPFGRSTGQLSEGDSNRMLTVTGVMVVVGLMAVIGIIVFRRRRSD